MRHKKPFAIAVALFVFAAFAVAALSPASAKRGRGPGERPSRAAQTKMRFKLDAHQWAVGDEVTGQVSLRSGRGRGELLVGAEVTVWVDGEQVGTAVTDDAGKTIATWGPATEGGHVMRVRYAGDDTHRPARAAQGFQVGDGTDEGEEEGDLEESPSPTPETTPTP